MRKRKFFTFLSLLVILSTVVSACGAPAPTPTPKVVEKVVEKTVEVTKVVKEVVKEKVVVTATPEPGGPKKGGTLVVALADTILTFDPADYRDRETETVLRNMFDGLVTRTKEGKVVLQMAESAKLVKPNVWEFKLRKGMKFHNGDPVTAEDVKFTFDRIINKDAIECPKPHTSPRKGLVARLKSVEVVDPLTVRFILEAPWPPFLQMLVHQQIIPKKYYESVGCEGFRKHPIGAGPFKFVSGNLDQEVVMERFDDYYGGSPDLPPVGPAFVDKLIFKFIPEESSRVAALKTGEVDVIQKVASYMIPTLATDPNVQVKSCASTRPMWLELNVNKPPFDDVNVRRALNYAIDKKLLVDKLTGGLGMVLTGPLSPLNNYVNKKLPGYPYDKEKALELFKKAGWELVDGKLMKDGKQMSFTIDTRTSLQTYAEAVGQQLRDFGIDAKVRTWGDYSVLKPLLLKGERMAAVADWGDSAFDPVGHFEAVWHSRKEGSPYGRGNFSGYSNPEVDKLIEDGEIETDTTKRHEIYDKAQEIIFDEVPAVFLILPPAIEAARTRVHNWSPSPDSRENMVDVWVSQ